VRSGWTVRASWPVLDLCPFSPIHDPLLNLTAAPDLRPVRLAHGVQDGDGDGDGRWALGADRGVQGR